jgi:radical SAM superfamily enzyme YgiQ (UPF0313 family)
MPDFILVTGASVEYHRQVHEALRIAKEYCPGCVTILGGVYPTTLPEEAAKDRNADWIFTHHAEERIEMFLDLIGRNSPDVKKFPGIAFRDGNGGIAINPPQSHIGNVATMVRPDYSLMSIDRYLRQTTLDYQFNSNNPAAFVITSYGCPYNCVFCASRTIQGKRVVYRPVEDVIAEIEFLARDHGVRNIIFLDEALLANGPRISALLTSLTALGYGIQWKAASVSAWHLSDELLELMARSGCIQITVSVESGCQRVLDEVIHKPLKLDVIPRIIRKCKELKIDIGANFVIGLPGETWDEIRQTFKFAEDCDFDLSHFHIATPQPKTDLYKMCVEKGYLPRDFSFLDPAYFGFGKGFITTEEFTPFELMALRAFEWDRINFTTPEKTANVARLYCTTPEKLNEHRRQTRRKLGIHF